MKLAATLLYAILRDSTLQRQNRHWLLNVFITYFCLKFYQIQTIKDMH